MVASPFLGFLLVHSRRERTVMFLAFGLSLSLFGLTILEAMPASIMSLLTHQNELAPAYWITLWLLSIYVVFVVPSLVGASVAMSFGHYVCCSPSQAKCTFFDARKLPWLVKFVYRLGFGLISLLFRNVFYCGMFWYYSGRQRQNSIDSFALPLHEEPPTCSSSEDMTQKIGSKSNKRSSVDSLAPMSKTYDDSRNCCTFKQQRLFAAIGGICGIIIALSLLSTIGPLVVQLPSTHKKSALSLFVSWICALGLLISSILNGFGSVSLPFTTLSGFFLQQVRPGHVEKLEVELKNMHEILYQKQKMSKELKVQIPALSRSKNKSPLSATSGSAFSVSSLLARTNSSDSGFMEIGAEIKKRRQVISMEIRFMEDLIRETTLDLEELKHSQMAAAAARTSIGKAKFYVGLVFSVILLIRLSNAGFSMYRRHNTSMSKSRSDIVTSVLLWLMGHHYFSHIQYNMLSQMVSLVLSAVLSFTQVTTFLRTANTIHRRASFFYKNCFFDGDDGTGIPSFNKNGSEQEPRMQFFWQVILAFLGCYSLACIVLIKMMLPERFSVAFSKALDEASIFTIRSSAVNTVFFSSAVVSAVVFGIILGIQRQNISKHTSALSRERGGSIVMSASFPDV